MLTEPHLQNVLLVGAGVSSTDIARELGPTAGRIYQVSRGGKFDLPPILLPPNATRIGSIASFAKSPSTEPGPLNDSSQPLPWRVILQDGRELTDIHRVILCTGYHISLPFLKQYHSDDTPVNKADDTVLVTDGTQMHNLHKDIFYIPDPSLVFIGVPYYTATFTLFEFQAMVVAAVLSKQAFLPSQSEMRMEYEERVRTRGAGKVFHSLKDREVEYVDELLGWVNRDRAKVGAGPVEGHTEAWHVANMDRLERVRKIFGKT
ncbi:hypothetical protein MMC21_003653 [Puttea exsequens]|nr:hypothetical protein [Puttea exsequens]